PTGVYDIAIEDNSSKAVLAVLADYIVEAPEQFDAGKLFYQPPVPLYIGYFAVGLLSVGIVYGFAIWRSRKIPEDSAPPCDSEKDRRFFLGRIGGKPKPRLDNETLNHLADSMGYFQSRQAGTVLNVPASIQATLEGDGIPTLAFYPRKQVRSLLILEDSAAEALAWNSLPRELAEGMQRRGIPVLYGRFSGSPAHFTADGARYHLEDLEDQRHGYLLLLFSDGKSFARPEYGFALETVAHWPMAAWMELREPRAWDAASALPSRYNIPLYPASPDGLVQAVGRFLTERGAQAELTFEAEERPGVPGPAGGSSDVSIETILGDALIWAQDCAMLQPLSPGLADVLRRRFHKHLPCERIERLYTLPGTMRSVAGLRFSNEVLQVLRRGFLIRRSDEEQKEVLQCILDEISAAKPAADKDSLAYLAWEAVRERVRLELDEENDLERLAELAKTPLGPVIGASLEDFGFPGEKAGIPLRLQPRNRHALQRLSRIAGHLNIPILKAYPIAGKQWFALGLIGLLSLGFFGWWSFEQYQTRQNQKESSGRWSVSGQSGIYAHLKKREAAAEEDSGAEERSGTLAELTQKPLQEGARYQLSVFGNGIAQSREIAAARQNRLHIMPGQTDISRPCLEKL
ncbi:MAG: hypothetical protein GY803_19425, partial [Chloroflexi bacterium]|nr:hypothetical protein [Chloroflexota bacterium]